MLGEIGLKYSIEDINQKSAREFHELLLSVCHSRNWAHLMADHRPFLNIDTFMETAEQIWFGLSADDWKEAFAAHPLIGDLSSLRAKVEQSGSTELTEESLSELAELNQRYFDQFGFIFIVFASGKTGMEMLELIRKRIGNTAQEELMNAAKEQAKITKHRLEQVL